MKIDPAGLLQRIGDAMSPNEVKYEKWLLTLPRSDEEYGTCNCPGCGSVGLRFQYFSVESGNVGWKCAWCPSCLSGVQVCRVIVPEAALVLRTEEEYRLFHDSHPGLRLVT